MIISFKNHLKEIKKLLKIEDLSDEKSSPKKDKEEK